MSKIKSSPDSNNKKRLFFILFIFILVIILFLAVRSLTDNKKYNDGDILEVEILVTSVKDNQDSPAKDHFHKVVNESLKDGKIEPYEYEDIMQAYSEVTKLEAVF